MLIGYMRVSSDSDRQSTDLQRDALLKVGVDARNIFEDHASGAKDDRTGLGEALEYVNSGDVFVVWKLDRLGRSLAHLISIVNRLREKRVSFRSLTENMDTSTPSGELFFHVFGALDFASIDPDSPWLAALTWVKSVFAKQKRPLSTLAC